MHLTRDRLQSRKDKAVRFVRDVLGDLDRAEEIAEESLEDYAARRKIQIINPFERRPKSMATKRELEERIRELEDENAELQDQLDAIADIAGGGEQEVETDEELEEEEEKGEEDEETTEG